jgi:hypothetical protein
MAGGREALGLPSAEVVDVRGSAAERSSAAARECDGVCTMKHSCPLLAPALALSGTLILGSASAQAAEETVPSMLAAQIRSQGFVCDKALGARKDAKRSRPDHAVWVLKCGNANYRVSRAPDMAARVEPLR